MRNRNSHAKRVIACTMGALVLGAILGRPVFAADPSRLTISRPAAIFVGEPAEFTVSTVFADKTVDASRTDRLDVTISMHGDKDSFNVTLVNGETRFTRTFDNPGAALIVARAADGSYASDNFFVTKKLDKKK